MRWSLHSGSLFGEFNIMAPFADSFATHFVEAVAGILSPQCTPVGPATGAESAMAAAVRSEKLAWNTFLNMVLNFCSAIKYACWRLGLWGVVFPYFGRT